MNQLESELNHFSEENEVLREKLGMGVEESVDVSIVRRRRDAERERLHKENRMLHNEARNTYLNTYICTCTFLWV